MKTLFVICSITVTMILLCTGLYVLTTIDVTKTEWFLVQAAMMMGLAGLMAGMMHLTTEWRRGRGEHFGPGVSSGDAFAIGVAVFTTLAVVIAVSVLWVQENTTNAFSEWAIFTMMFGTIVEHIFNPIARRAYNKSAFTRAH